MAIDINTAVASLAALATAHAAYSARRSAKFSEIALRNISYAEVQTRPSVEVQGIVEVNGVYRAKLIVFNQRETALRIHTVRLFRLNPKSWSLANWLRSKRDVDFDWNYEYEGTIWNPKGTLDDVEYSADDRTWPLTLVSKTEIVLVTLRRYTENPYQKYRFEVVTSQGTTSQECVPSSGRQTLPTDFQMEITDLSMK
jgi:hypothetical protein